MNEPYFDDEDEIIPPLGEDADDFDNDTEDNELEEDI